MTNWIQASEAGRMNVQRHVVYWLHKCSILKFSNYVFGILVHTVVGRTLTDRYYEGIQLIAYPPYGSAQLGAIVDALELIQKIDARRFRRVERHIKQIILANWSKRIVGRYIPLGKACHLRKLPDVERSRRFQVWTYALTIVHDATHGFLDSRRFPHTKTNQSRIERICKREEIRFGTKIPGMKEKIDGFGGYSKFVVLQSGSSWPPK